MTAHESTPTNNTVFALCENTSLQCEQRNQCFQQNMVFAYIDTASSAELDAISQFDSDEVVNAKIMILDQQRALLGKCGVWAAVNDDIDTIS